MSLGSLAWQLSFPLRTADLQVPIAVPDENFTDSNLQHVHISVSCSSGIKLKLADNRNAWDIMKYTIDLSIDSPPKDSTPPLNLAQLHFSFLQSGAHTIALRNE
jgi:hypothetical protein